MVSTPHLLGHYAGLVQQLAPGDLRQPRLVAGLHMERAQVGGKEIEMVYAPFDHVNLEARVVIVGMTPGHTQAVNALVAAREALSSGKSVNAAAEAAKVFASFSGEPMRGNLVRMLDEIGLARFLGISSVVELWGRAAHLVHFTSALRYPVFVDGKNWSGQPDMVRTRELREWLEAYAGSELALLPSAVIVPLGPKVSLAMQHLVEKGIISASRVLDGLPHPSGANAERIAYFLWNKPAELCSSKTNTASIDRARASLVAKLAAL